MPQGRLTGSLWIEDVRINWIDTNGNRKLITGVDLGDRTGDGAFLGCPWVEGDNLHYIDGNNHERKINAFLGDVVAGKPGSIWIEPVVHQLRWITESTSKVASVGDF